MYCKLIDILESAMEDGVRVEVVVEDGETFTALPVGSNDGEDDLAWDFDDVIGVTYSIVPLKNMTSVRCV